MPMQSYMNNLPEVWKLGERPQGPGWRKSNLGSDTNLMHNLHQWNLSLDGDSRGPAAPPRESPLVGVKLKTTKLSLKTNYLKSQNLSFLLDSLSSPFWGISFSLYRRGSGGDPFNGPTT